MKALLWNLNRQRPKMSRPKFLTGFIFLFSIFCFLFSIRAEARIYIQIDQPSEKKFPIAVADLVPSDEVSKDWNRKVSALIRKNLAMTGLFDLVDPLEFPKETSALDPNPGRIQFAPWSFIGVQALINGTYTKGKDSIRVEMNLYDPLLGQRLISRSYTAKPKEMSVVAHNFADQVMQELTGETGVFSTRITYVQVSKKIKEVGVMDMDGENARTITKDKTTDLSPAWSPDSSEIAYTTFTREGYPEISTVGSSGGIPRRVTDNRSINVSPAWTPNGTLTVASAFQGDTDIYLMNRNGGVIKKLTDSYGIDVNPSWSPDGSAFVFASERAGRLHLFKSDASGSGVERLTFVGTQNDNPSWSPKGDKIAFQSLSGGWNIFIMNADGSMIQKLSSAGCESPSWAPNGRFIAASCGGQITIFRDDGSAETRVGPKNAAQPSWGPPTP